jgi:hypothetical protein
VGGCAGTHCIRTWRGQPPRVDQHCLHRHRVTTPTAYAHVPKQSTLPLTCYCCGHSVPQSHHVAELTSTALTAAGHLLPLTIHTQTHSHSSPVVMAAAALLPYSVSNQLPGGPSHAISRLQSVSCTRSSLNRLPPPPRWCASPVTAAGTLLPSPTKSFELTSTAFTATGCDSRLFIRVEIW